MDVAQWLVYFTILIALHASPGPDNVLVSCTSLTKGFRAGITLVLGISSAMLIHLALTAFGLAAVVTAHPVMLEIIKFIGFIYLIWLGVQSVKRPTSTTSASVTSGYTALWRMGFFNNLLNPKAWIFYLVLLPQFMDSDSSLLIQYGMLGGVMVLFNFCFLSALALLAAHLAKHLSFTDVRWGRYLMSSVFFIMAGGLLLQQGEGVESLIGLG